MLGEKGLGVKDREGGGLENRVCRDGEVGWGREGLKGGILEVGGGDEGLKDGGEKKGVKEGLVGVELGGVYGGDENGMMVGGVVIWG